MEEELEYRTFIPVLVRAVPELIPLYEEHLRDNDELLPHVFMGDVTRFVIDAYARSMLPGKDGQHWSQVLDKVMSTLEGAAASPNLGLVNLVTVSFCENLLDLEEKDIAAYRGIREKMGPKLTEQMQAIREYWYGGANA